MRDSWPTSEMTVPSVPLGAVTRLVARGAWSFSCFATQKQMMTQPLLYQCFLTIIYVSRTSLNFPLPVHSPEADSLRPEMFPPGSDLRTDKPEGPVQGRHLAPEAAGSSGGVHWGGQGDPHRDAGRTGRRLSGSHGVRADGAAGGREQRGMSVNQSSVPLFLLF